MELALQHLVTPAQFAAIIQAVAAKGSVIREFRVSMGHFDRDFFTVEALRPERLEQVEIDWATIFGFMPRLRRLDLVGVPLLSRHFDNILEAASTSCPYVEFLILPWKGDIMQSVSGCERVKLTVLCSAMETWYVKGRCGGLQLLALPSCKEKNSLPFRSSKYLFDALARFCPGIEYVAKHQLINLLRTDYYDDKWALSLETWKTFNASCTALKTSHWRVVPFADPFFRVFGYHVKPQLKTLAIWSNPTWNYKRCLQELEGSTLAEARECPGYGVLATDVAAVMKACPALTRLFIEIHHLGGYRTDEFYEDVEVYGDVFWAAVARHCPDLKEIRVSNCSDHDDIHIIFVKTLTDRALMHLAGLPYLLECSLPPGRVTGRSIFEYIRCVSNTKNLVGNKRSILIGIGGITRNPVEMPTFYLEIVELLKLLAEIDEKSLGAASCHPKPCARVDHPYEFCPNFAWFDTYIRDEVRPLLKTVQGKHPSLKVDIDTSGSEIDKMKLRWVS
ncbi:hypothetical protein PF002_g10416 [Phytophthora fragariae]|uniref:Uncharacterized protein n=2 Tax=Phytophthora fragariae TaxID=53985 RepID=A0A6A3F810_9STRA|nr:hypothetical protein PF003_g13871 [Phytophthora fragariae]KAE8939930.1 hypothetical protein PF009_g10234 [Phytophthora fragariae]KAE9239147.1 hypothetical protein PF002_g10416 [Phytophthora fragariae]